MSVRVKIESKYPGTWSQLYALAYGEACALIESLLDDTISRDELAELFRAQADEQHLRVQRLIDNMQAEMSATKPLE